MSEPFIAEIKIFAGNFAPRSYAFCNGQLLSIAQNTALFALVGTTYGGDGRTTFGLPNLQDSAPMHAGNGPGLTQRRLGSRFGEPTVQLNAVHIPQHKHSAVASTAKNTRSDPESHTWGDGNGNTYYRPAADINTNLSYHALGDSGGGQVHNNMPPYLTLTFIIALQGLFPSRA